MNEFLRRRIIDIPLLLLIFFTHTYRETFAQQPAYFTKVFGDSSYFNYGNSLVQIPGGSIYYAGSSNVNLIGGTDISLSKFDESGNFIWRKYFGTTDDESCAKMVMLNNVFVICGQSYDNTSLSSDGFLLAVDTSGNELWQQQIGTPTGSESFLGLCVSHAGGLLASGYSSGSGNPGSDFWLVKTDSLGNMEWENFYGGAGISESSDAVFQMTNGEILISGDKEISATTFNAWLIKTDSLGNTIWNTILTNIRNGGCKNLVVDSDDNIYVIGEAATDSSANFDIQLSKVDQSGTMQWLRYVRASNQSDAGFDLVETPDHNLMITGYYFDTTEWKKKIQMLLVDSSANEISRKLFGTSLQNIGYDIIPSVNGGYLIAGTDFILGQCLLIYDNILTDGINEDSRDENLISVFPNPAFDRVYINLNGHPETRSISVYDSFGKEVQDCIMTGNQLMLNIENLEPGIYFLQLIAGSRIVSAKFLVR